MAYTYIFFIRLAEYLFDVVEENLFIMRREAHLFAGTFFIILGMLNFSSNKYCDGNTAEYLSCTRPTTYYYYGWLQVAFVILGVFLILLWVLKRRER